MRMRMFIARKSVELKRMYLSFAARKCITHEGVLDIKDNLAQARWGHVDKESAIHNAKALRTGGVVQAVYRLETDGLVMVSACVAKGVACVWLAREFDYHVVFEESSSVNPPWHVLVPGRLV